MPAAHKILWIHSDIPDAVESRTAESLSNHSLRNASSVPEALRLVEEEEIDVIFANFPAKEWNPGELLEYLRHARTNTPVFVRDRGATLEDAVALARLGVERLYGGEAAVEEMTHAVESSLEEQRARQRARTIGMPWQNLLVGESRAMEKVSKMIGLVAAKRCTVLITGETGTGKEMAARAIHMASSRAHLPLVAVNCSAIPETLLEAELFGYVKGAFTGAQQHRAGRFEQAHRGTLFLDEIGEMPLELQAKLLRVLQEREFQKLGSSETVKVDVRIIAASNVDLGARVREGRFREDLYYRLNVVPIEMPPLRDRLSDLPALAHALAAKICRNEAIALKTLSRGAIAKLSAYSWPGNVRQLENALELAIVMSGDRAELLAQDFSLPFAPFVPAAAAIDEMMLPDHGLDFEQTVTRFERNILTQALRKTRGNKKMAADMLGLKRTTLSAKVRTLELAAGCPLG